jgi:hypothetical protein
MFERVIMNNGISASPKASCSDSSTQQRVNGVAPGFYRWQRRLGWSSPAAMLLVFAAALASAHAAQPDTGQGSKGGGISFRDGNLSVSVANVSRVDLLNRIGREAGFKVIVVGDVRPDTRSWSFADLPLRKALKRLLADTNAIVAEGSNSDPAQPISSIYLLGSGSGTIRSLEVVSVEAEPDQARPAEGSVDDGASQPQPANMQQQDFDYAAQAELVNRLQFDPSEEARMRALNDLQAMGGDNLRAVLESALGDSDEKIRQQAERLLANLPE